MRASPPVYSLSIVIKAFTSISRRKIVPCILNGNMRRMSLTYLSPSPGVTTSTICTSVRARDVTRMAIGNERDNRANERDGRAEEREVAGNFLLAPEDRKGAQEDRDDAKSDRHQAEIDRIHSAKDQDA